jgi:hypothetical protein
MATIEFVARTAVSRVALSILAKVWIAVLIVGSLQPARPLIVKGVHSELHWVAFGGAAFLLYCLAETRRQEILRAFSMFFLGLTLEVTQYLMNQYQMEWHDVRDDGLAILAAFALYRLTGAWKPASDPNPQ